MSLHEPVTLTTKYGHEIRAVVDHVSGHVSAKVVNAHTGVMRALDDEALLNIRDWVRAGKLQRQAEAMATETLNMVPGGARMLGLLGENHPGIRPYAEEISKHEALAKHAAQAAVQLGVRVVTAADRIAEANVPRAQSARQI